MKRLCVIIAAQLSLSVQAEMPHVADAIKVNQRKIFSRYDKTENQFSSEFCRLILNSAPDIIKEKLWVLKNSTDPQCLQRRKFLFYGPSGSGKTTLAQVMAQDLGRPLLYINAGELANEYANSANSNFRRIIDEQLEADSVLVIDEMDCILGEQNNKTSPDINTPAQAWSTLDYIHREYPNVLIIGVTNKIERLPDPVRTRFSQLTLKIASTENPELRKNILTHYLKNVAHECDEKFLTSFASQASKISIRDLVHLVIEAKEIAAARNANPRLIIKKDIEEALKRALSRKKEADNVDSSWLPSEKSVKKTVDGLLKLLAIIAYAQNIQNGLGDKKSNPDSDLETIKKA